MEDIKRVITFDSVEEFWGYVLRPLIVLTDEMTPFADCTTTSYRHRTCPQRQIITFSRWAERRRELNAKS
jgi:hypothetical protein